MLQEDIFLVEFDTFIAGTSATNNSIAVGQASFTLDSDIDFITGMSVTCNAGGGNDMLATVINYDSSTFTLIVDVSSINGAGAFASWGISGINRFYFSTNEGFSTLPTDTPANTTFENRLINPANVERNLYAKATTRGKSDVSFGSVILNNADAKLDGLLNYGLDGREVIIRKGVKGAAYPAEWTTLLIGTLEQGEFSWRRITLRIRDRLAEISELEFQNIQYLGDNVLPVGVEGIADDIKGKPKPILYGQVVNLEPPLVNTSLLTYQISAQEITTIDFVYVQGSVISVGTAHASLALLQAASIANGFFDYYLGAGGDGAYFRLGSIASGQVTCDATQGATVADRTVAQIIKNIITIQGGLQPTDIDDASFIALDALNSDIAGFWSNLVNQDIGSIVDEVAESIGAFLIADALGKFSVGRLELPIAPAVADFAAWQVIDSGNGIQRIVSNDTDRGIPAFRVDLQYLKNYTVQGDSQLAGIALPKLNFLQSEYRNVNANDPNVTIVHPLSKPVEITTLLLNEVDAQAEAERLLIIYKERRDILEIALPVEYTQDVNLNDVVSLTINRYDWQNGKLFRVIGKTQDFSRDITTLTIWG